MSNNSGQVTSYQLHLPFVSNNSGQCHRWKQILTYSSFVLVGIYEGAVRRPSKAEFFVMFQIPKIISVRRLRWFRSLSRSRGTRDVRQFFDWKCSAKDCGRRMVALKKPQSQCPIRALSFQVAFTTFHHMSCRFIG